jgi:hypothetical protein
MVEDLQLPANGLSVATSIFFVTYIIFEVPATMLLRKLRPSRLIPACTIIWGGVVVGNGFAQNYGTLLACRLLLGICEAGLFPSLVLYMSSFYQREELALRNCYLFIAACMSGVIGGLIATGFLKMDGLRGLAGWRWLYIIEGALTIVVGIGAAFVIADTYEEARYLTDREKFVMKVRQAKAFAFTRDEGFSWAEFWKYIRDPMIYLSGFVLLCMDTCMYGFVSTPSSDFADTSVHVPRRHHQRSRLHSRSEPSALSTSIRLGSHRVHLRRDRLGPLLRAVQDHPPVRHGPAHWVLDPRRVPFQHWRAPLCMLRRRHGHLHLCRAARHLAWAEHGRVPQAELRDWYPAQYG